VTAERPPQPPDGRTSPAYWAEVASRQPTSRAGSWRQHADCVNRDLCVRWWPDTPVGRVLKTDLFDEACGEGLLPFALGRAHEAHGIDHALEAAARARPHVGAAALTTADVRRLPYANDAFDLVLSNSTLDHFEEVAELERSLAEIHRVLAPGGRLILTLDNPVNPIVALRNVLPFRVLRRTGLVPYFVGVTCGRRTGSGLLASAGFDVLETTAVMHCPRAPAVALAGWVDRRGPRARRRFLGGLHVCERLGDWPSRYLTGYFVAWLARKPAGQLDGVTAR
jgi:SAM-dependent methyltransferase